MLRKLRSCSWNVGRLVLPRDGWTTGWLHTPWLATLQRLGTDRPQCFRFASQSPVLAAAIKSTGNGQKKRRRIISSSEDEDEEEAEPKQKSATPMKR